jgi:tetratricopeptide (TPR) repeat protein
MPIRFLLVLLLAASSLYIGIARAEESAKQLSTKAQEECDLGRRANDRADRLAHFEKSRVLAERAVALDDKLADAHFALFCSLGERSRIDGEKSVGAVAGFGKVMQELDRTLELDPDHLDALSSKGAFLIRLPVLLGGNAKKGEEMLRRVIQRDPRSISARLTLAKAYAARGKEAEAITLATDALKFARADRRADLIPEAEATLAELRSASRDSRSAGG